MLELFAPIVDDDSEILVLGSMPGRESLAAGEYYKNARNAFWRIISVLFNDGLPFVDYEDKIACLKRNHIALWDTLKYCEREGSLDANIRNAVRNDIAAFLYDVRWLAIEKIDSVNWLSADKDIIMLLRAIE